MFSTSSRPAPDGLTIMFEHCTDQPYYQANNSGMVSGRSSPATSSSPSTPTDLYSHSPLDVAVASEDSWNLIPCDVPWGPEYYHYRAGTLPGPDGQCIFLRSPTPLKNRRTQNRMFLSIVCMFGGQWIPDGGCTQGTLADACALEGGSQGRTKHYSRREHRNRSFAS